MSAQATPCAAVTEPQEEAPQAVDPGCEVRIHAVVEHDERRGRPTDYRPQFCESAMRLAQTGATDFEISQALDCHPSTLYRWYAEHPEFRDAVKLGKECPDDRVERSVYARACGYSYPAVKIMQFEGMPMAVRYTEHVPPDVGAATLWLTNRKPKEWRQSKTLEVKQGALDASELERIDAILAKFQRLKQQRGVLEGEVVKPPALTNGHG